MDTEKEIEGLQTLVGYLWKRLDDVSDLALALRELLAQDGALAVGRIDTRVDEIKKDRHAAMLKAFEKGAEASSEQAMRRLLESFKGPKQ